MHIIVTVYELKIMLFAVIFGCIFGFIYDIIKMVRLMLLVGDTSTRRGRAFLNITDVLYMAMLSVSFCIFLYYYNKGIFRWYLALSLFVGYIIYRYSIGRAFCYFSFKLVGAIHKLMYYVVVVPIVYICKFFGRLFAPFIRRAEMRRAIKRTERIRLSLISKIQDQSGKEAYL